MSDFRDIAEFHASAQLSEIPRSSHSPNPQSVPVTGSRGRNFKLRPEILFIQNSDRIKQSRMLLRWEENLRVSKRTLKSPGRLWLRYRKARICYY